MRQRWDAEQQRWVDDEGGSGARPKTPDTPWWAGAETQVGPAGPPGPAPAPPPLPRSATPPPTYVPYAQPATPIPTPAPDPAPTPPQPVPPARARGPRTGLVLVAVVAVLAGGGAGAAVWWAARDHGTGHHQAGPAAHASVSATAPAGASAPPATPTPSATDEASASTTPETVASTGPSPGYRRAVDPVGYSLDVPDGWTRQEERGVSAEVVTYSSPGGDSSLKLFEVVEQTPAKSLDLAENGPSGFVQVLHGYRVLKRASGPGWSELDYRYDDTTSGPTQVIDRRFAAADGRLYAIRSSGPEGSDVTAPFTAAYDSFCPSGATCPAG